MHSLMPRGPTQQLDKPLAARDAPGHTLLPVPWSPVLLVEESRRWEGRMWGGGFRWRPRMGLQQWGWGLRWGGKGGVEIRVRNNNFICPLLG